MTAKTRFHFRRAGAMAMGGTAALLLPAPAGAQKIAQRPFTVWENEERITLRGKSPEASGKC